MDVESLFSVKGKIVLVTGGARGIGRMISEGFVRNGARVYVASRDKDACAAAVAELNALDRGGSAVSLPADLSSEAECRRLIDEIARAEGGRLHVLVNNSGAAWGASFDEYPDHAWTKVLTLNLQRVFTLTQAATPLLEKAAAESRPGHSADTLPTDPSRVIHIGSIDALRVPNIKNFAYSASKAGLHHLSRTLAIELGPRGITSNTVACGPFPSKMMAATLRAAGDAIRASNPLGRIGEPSDVAGACLFLASKAGAYVNGATVRVDGGVSLMAKM